MPNYGEIMVKNTKKAMNVNKNTNKFSQVNPLVGGLDIGANSIYACVGLSDGSQRVREFSTFTSDLKKMAAWFKKHKNSTVAMESTGVYWIASYDILAQSGIKPVLVNAHHLKSVPGRKTDVKDCQWIQQLHSYGLLRGSFRPDDDGVKFRTLVRQRSRLLESSSVQVQLMHKALAQMNIQMRQVISSITGVTGLNIIRSIISGETNSVELAKLRDARCKKSEGEIALALEGNFRPELIFSLKQAVDGYDFFQKQVCECEDKIKEILECWNNEQETISRNAENKERLNTKKTYNKSTYQFDAGDKLKKFTGVDLTEVPGIDDSTAIKIISEIGFDMKYWPSAKHFASWLGLCPGNKISGGKVLCSKTKPTANKAAQALRMAANALYASKTALGAFFRRMRARLGTPKAITATAHKLAIIIYNMLACKRPFHEAGQEEYERRYRARSIANLKRRAKNMGFELVEIE